MSLYADYVFPRLMDWTLGADRFQAERKATLASVHGRVLEIGFGTGLNLPHYPDTVTWLTGVEPGGLLEQKVTERSSVAAMPVEVLHLSAEALPWDDARFDCVVSTWTLCSIRDPVLALGEVRRVLKPGGRLVFLEHGRSADAQVAKWQDRLTPIQRIVACGCHLNRRIDMLVSESGLKVERLDRYLLEGIPRIAGEMYRGCAVAP